MPVIVRGDDVTAADAGEGCHWFAYLTPEVIGSDQIELERIRFTKGASCAIKLDDHAIGWVQLLRGKGRLDDSGQEITTGQIAYMPAGFADTFTAAADDTEFLIAKVPHARRFDENLPTTMPPDLHSVLWTREPVLQSEHDARTRVYLATPALAGTEAFRGEMITYPPGASAPEHHHEGAEHFQYMLSGEATAMLDGVPYKLRTGDLLYNYQNERHTFVNETRQNFSFVEFFVPGPCKTVWSPGANVCAWLPTGADIEGRPPVRDIGYHVHGQDSGI